jgi:hypothetical protein
VSPYGDGALATARAPAEIAVSAMDTLLVLARHQAGCGQCRVDDSFCDTAQTYQQSFVDEMRRYAQVKRRA